MSGNKWTSGEDFFEVDTSEAAVDLGQDINADAHYEPQPRRGEALPRFRRQPQQRPQRQRAPRAAQPGTFTYRNGDDE